MMKFVVNIAVTFASLYFFAQTPANDPHWEIDPLRSDEFNSTTINTNLWKVYHNHDGFGGGTPFTNASEKRSMNTPQFLPVYLEENVYTEQIPPDPANPLPGINRALVMRIKRETANGGYTCDSYALEPDYMQYHCYWQGLSVHPGIPNIIKLALGLLNFKYQYSAGAIEIQPEYFFRYGYVEARIKFPDVIGVWPAFWTYWADWDYTENPPKMNLSSEIDIVELVPGSNHYPDEDKQHVDLDPFPPIHNKFVMTTNVHPGDDDACEPHCNPDSYFRPHYINDYTQWHTYGLEWTPNKLIFYLDGKVIRTQQLPMYAKKWETNDDTGDDELVLVPNPFNQFHDLRIGAGINPFVITEAIHSHLPAQTMVDYIRFYKYKNDCNTPINSCTFNWNNYNNHVKKSISIGGNGCFNSVPSGQNRVLRATEFIEIKGDFTVPLGAEFYMDVNTCH